MSVVYNKKRNEYRAYYGNQKKTCYSVNKYGDYAEILTKMAMVEKRRVINYIVEEKDYAIVKIHSKKHGYFDVLIDKEDIDKIKDILWYISPKGKTFYAENNNYGGMHRVILENIDKNDITDHINRNGLDNRKQNLRLVNKSMNSRNINIKSNNKTGVMGVEFDNRRYISTARDFEGNKLRKHFSVKKYGTIEAFNLAVQQRKIWEKKYYAHDLKRSTTRAKARTS